MKAVAYTRVSHEEQATGGVSLDMQKAKLMAYAELNDIEIVDLCTDSGISAKSIKGRPGFQKALDLVYTGKADALLTWKLDRCFRSTTDALSVAQELNKSNRALISVSEKLDTSSAVGEFFYSLMASLAQMERRLVGERTKAALAQKRAQGMKTGGDCPYGFDVTQDGKLIPNPEEQAVIARIRELEADGYSIRRICSALVAEGIMSRTGKPFGRTTIHRILSRAA